MATKNEIILSVKTDMLLDQAWQLIEKDGDKIQDEFALFDILFVLRNRVVQGRFHKRRSFFQ